MEVFEHSFSGVVVALALASVLVLLRRPRKSTAELLFAVFCGSLALSLLQPEFASAPAWAQLGLIVGGCATCNAYWLVSRALFRGDRGVGAFEIAAAVAIAVLIVAYRALKATESEGVALAALGGLLTLASSTVLVLAFFEALRGYGASAGRERRLRQGFMGVYGGCVLLGTLAGALAEAEPGWAPAQRMVVLACALAILAFTHVALEIRRRLMAETEAGAAQADSSAEESDPALQALAERLLRVVEDDRLFRQADLRVVDLAAHVGSKAHRVSRAINQVLGAPNFNQWINRYRIEYACRVLRESPGRSVLEISLDAGFGSLGPFNRAFKSAMGCTPSAWRARGRQASAAGPDAHEALLSES